MLERERERRRRRRRGGGGDDWVPEKRKGFALKWRELAVVGDGQKWIDRMEERERRDFDFGKKKNEFFILDGKWKGKWNEEVFFFTFFSFFFCIKNCEEKKIEKFSLV